MHPRERPVRGRKKVGVNAGSDSGLLSRAVLAPSDLHAFTGCVAAIWPHPPLQVLVGACDAILSNARCLDWH